MAKLATKPIAAKAATTTTTTTAAPKTGPKLAAAKGAAKPAKLATKVEKPKAEKLTVKVGDTVNFIGYKDRPEDQTPMFEPGQRLVLVNKDKDADSGLTYFEAVLEEDAEAYKLTPDDVNGDQVYPAEIEKAEKAEVDVFAIPMITNDTLDEIVAGYDSPLDAAKGLLEETAKNLFYLGGIYQMLFVGRAYLAYGDNGEGKPNDYADDLDEEGVPKKQSGWNKFTQENFNEHGRAAIDKISIFRSFAGLLPQDKLEEIASDKKIGYVKLAAATKVVTADNVDEIVELARNSNVSDFKESIKTDYVEDKGTARTGGTSSAKVKRTQIKLAFFEDQAASVDYVIAQAKKEFAIEDLNQVMERIIMEWAVQNLNEATVKKAKTAKKNKLKELKASGVDIKDRQEADSDLEEYLSRNEGAEEAAA